MRKSINLPRLLSGITVAVLWCLAFVCPAKAEICYLPTGICEESSVPKAALFTCNEEHCSSDNYYEKDKGEGWSCTYDECCRKWHCIIIDCQILGYHDGPTVSEGIWPSNRQKEDGWECKPCKQGDYYYWSCKRKSCYNGVTPDKCNKETQDFTPVDEYGMSGGERCGVCVPKQCPIGTKTKEEVLAMSGCFKAIPDDKKSVGSLICYRIETLTGYMLEDDYTSKYDQSCYSFTERRSSNGQLCFKAEARTSCDNTYQYISKRIVGGKEICECVNYDYNLAVSKEEIVLHAANLMDSSKADEATITVTSTRYSDDGVISGAKTEDWAWEYVNTSALTLEKNGNELKIIGVINASQTTDLNYTFDVVQTQENGVDKKTITVKVRIEHDTCPTITENGVQKATKFESTCPQSGWLPVAKARSVTGVNCYICYNDNCPVCPINKPEYSNYCPTFSKTKCCGEGNYFEEVTEYGSICYGQKNDTCPPNYPNKGGNPSSDKCREFTTTDFGSSCYKDIPDDCAATNGGKSYIKGTAPADGKTYVYGNDTECGSKCYIDDTCPDGYTIKKGVGEACPTDGNYESKTTNYGSTCCKPKADDCVAANGGKPYVKGTAPSDNGHTYKYGNDTPFGSHCYIDDTCPAGYTIKKGVGEACPVNGGGCRYESTTTTYGSICCQCIPDVCPDNYPLLQCPSGKQCQSTTTTNGKVCYADDTCPTGYTKGATPTSGYYHTEATPFGSNCYIDDNCPSNYPDRACGTGKTCQSLANATAYGTTCYIDDTCPNGTGVKKGKNESCPSPNTGCVYTFETTAYGSKCCTQSCDSCPATYPYTSCSFTRCQSTTTTNGLTCYRDDSCTSGYTYGATPTTGYYCTTSTPAGNNCYKDDNCPDDYPLRACNSGGCKEKKNATACGRTCYKQDDVCPSGYTKGSVPTFPAQGNKNYKNASGNYYAYKASGAILNADNSYSTGTVEYGDNGFATVKTPAGSTCYKCGRLNPEHGFFGDCCTEDTDCRTDEFPLYCNFRKDGTGIGICTECDKDKIEDCRWVASDTGSDLWAQESYLWNCGKADHNQYDSLTDISVCGEHACCRAIVTVNNAIKAGAKGQGRKNFETRNLPLVDYKDDKDACIGKTATATTCLRGRFSYAKTFTTEETAYYLMHRKVVGCTSFGECRSF